MENQQLESTMATTHALLQEEGLTEAARLIRDYQIRAEQTGYDNWNGGTEIWEVYIQIPPKEFARIGARKNQLEEQITARLKVVLEPETEDWYSAKIIPAKVKDSNWRAENSDVPAKIRRNIIDGLQLENTVWHGGLDEVEFLSRIFDLKSLPSFDSRFDDAAGDIWKHCINNDDWDRGWVYTDKRFNLIEGPTDVFLRFLCETVHPVIRPNRDETVKLVSHFNDQLRQAGWEIYEEEKIAGRPRFSYRQSSNHEHHSVTRARTVAEALNAGWMAKEIERLERSLENDPALTIGTAKDLVESCCKTILGERGVEINKSDDLGDLTKKLTKELKLVPEDITEEKKGAETIRLILRNLTQLTSNLARLRNLYGSGHGRDGQYRGLQPRHARLAVASAVAFIDFIVETHRYRKAPLSNEQEE